MDAQEFDELIRRGEELVPQGGVLAWNGTMQPEYYSWRVESITAIRSLHEDANTILEGVLADQSGNYFYQSSVQLVLGALKAARALAERRRQLNKAVSSPPTKAELQLALARLESVLIMYTATSEGRIDKYAEEYPALRQVLMLHPSLQQALPDIYAGQTITEVLKILQARMQSYAERKQYLADAFKNARQSLERPNRTLADEQALEVIHALDQKRVEEIWLRALDRLTTDPEGAITSARTLLESVCKLILEDLDGKKSYSDADDLPRLYHQVAEKLKLRPDDKAEQALKQALGGCAAVVNGVGLLRNQLSDAHERGSEHPELDPSIARLSVTLAGSAAAFLTQAWLKRKANGN